MIVACVEQHITVCRLEKVRLIPRSPSTVSSFVLAVAVTTKLQYSVGVVSAKKFLNSIDTKLKLTSIPIISLWLSQFSPNVMVALHELLPPRVLLPNVQLMLAGSETSLTVTKLF